MRVVVGSCVSECWQTGAPAGRPSGRNRLGSTALVNLGHHSPDFRSGEMRQFSVL